VKIAQATLALVTVAALAVLAGCTADAPSPSGSPIASSSATSTPRPTSSEAALPANALFRITAVVSSKSSGATARLVETVLAPSNGDGTEAAQMSTAKCGDTGWTNQYVRPSWLSVTVTSELLSGSVWPAEDGVGVKTTGRNAFPAWSGDVRPFQAYCASGLATIPGTGHAVLPVDGVAGADDPHSWGTWQYGFDWAVDGGLGPGDQPFTFTSCTLERGPAATASATVSAWNPAQPVSPGDGFSPQCYWGALS
jgi:hypothetical protein